MANLYPDYFNDLASERLTSAMNASGKLYPCSFVKKVQEKNYETLILPFGLEGFDFVSVSEKEHGRIVRKAFVIYGNALKEIEYSEYEEIKKHQEEIKFYSESYKYNKHIVESLLTFLKSTDIYFSSLSLKYIMKFQETDIINANEETIHYLELCEAIKEARSKIRNYLYSTPYIKTKTPEIN